MLIAWDPLPSEELKGDQSNQAFFASVESVISNQTDVPYMNVNGGLQPSTSYLFHVSRRQLVLVYCSLGSDLDVSLPCCALH